MLREIARLIDKRLDIYIEPPVHCATHYVAEIMMTVALRWKDFTPKDQEFIKSIISVDDSYDPPLINL